MRKLKILLIILLCPWHFVIAQRPAVPGKTITASLADKGAKKYNSLLWEISGNGLKKPSYLFGTMHISDKLAFHLGDTFYNAIKSVDVVALESNPDNWQDDYSESVFLKTRGGYGFNSPYFLMGMRNQDKLLITSFAVENYDEAIKASLAVEPSMINGLLYRTYGNSMADFEEDTYLDMYIFQTGKKLGKKAAGVENFQESEKLVIEAYRDMYKDEKRKRKSFDIEGMFSNPKKIEEAYRKGDLDMLDSLDALEVTSEAFEEKFLYKRNEIQARNIDSIIKKSSLFVAVGAAHLPGKRGVIELLRSQGYTLRPLKMDDRNSRQKDLIDNARFSTTFVKQVSEDSLYEVSIPGKKFYSFTEWGGMSVKQFADMANGSYYMVVRVKYNTGFSGLSAGSVHNKIDSFLYENIPGKIIKKTALLKNGYKGWDIVNRIRRGDYQRYNIFVTPFEIIVFKISGNGEYITRGNEAQQFFNSVKLKEFKEFSWVKYTPQTGGFMVQLPHVPSLTRNENSGNSRLEYSAIDQQNNYLVIQSNLHNYSFIEEDSFELNLMDESYSYSSSVSKQLWRNFVNRNGYPGLESKYLHKDGSFSNVLYVIRGPVYYMAVVHTKKDNDASKKFIESFSISPFKYPEAKERKDTILNFSVTSPFFPEEKKKTELENMIMLMNLYSYSDDEEDDNELSQDIFDLKNFQLIGNDTIGEKIFVACRKPFPYSYLKDSTELWKMEKYDEDDNSDTSFIIKMDKRYELPGGILCREIQKTDTGSSRLILNKQIYKNGYLYSLNAITDTLSTSPFLSQFFSSFTPTDTVKRESLFTKKTKTFLNDYFSTDSAVAKKARKYLDEIEFDSTDASLLEEAIEKINWKTKNYTDVKKQLIGELGFIKDSTVTGFLKSLYLKVKDTSDFQNTILNALLTQKTRSSFIAFKEMILQETPVETDDYSGNRYNSTSILRYLRNGAAPRSLISFTNSNYDHDTWQELYDTLALTKFIYPDILQLINVDDYKEQVIDLTVALVDSGYLSAADYESWFAKFYLDAKQYMKKQVAKEDNSNIEKESMKDKKKRYYMDDDEEQELDEGNELLEKHAVLMLPFYEKKPGIPALFEQMLKTKDLQLYYNTCILLLRNNKAVPDTFFSRYAKSDEYRSRLYKDLLKMKKIDKFPSASKNQEALTRSLALSELSDYEKPDSLIYLEKLPVTYKNKKGWVYFYKYKEKRDDTFWQLGSVGMQPENADSMDIENDDFTLMDGRKIKTGMDIKEQLEKMLKELLNSKRECATEFYNARRYNIYREYLSDIVKSNRFRD